MREALVTTGFFVFNTSLNRKSVKKPVNCRSFPACISSNRDQNCPTRNHLLFAKPTNFMLYSQSVPNQGEFVTIGAFAFRRSKRLAIFYIKII